MPPLVVLPRASPPRVALAEWLASAERARRAAWLPEVREKPERL